jgi:hypothetical protein
MQVGDGVCRRLRLGNGIAAADIDGVEYCARAVVGTDPCELRDAGEYRSLVYLRGNDLTIPYVRSIAISGDQDNGWAPFTPALQEHFAPATNVDQARESAWSRRRRVEKRRDWSGYRLGASGYLV